MKRAALLLLAAAACTKWDSVKTAYCTFHAGQGDCAGTGGGSADAGVDGGDAGGGFGPYDGGPALDWAVPLGGIGDDSAGALTLSPGEEALAVSGLFTNAISLGGTGFISAGSSGATAQFLVQLSVGDGGITDGNGIQCGMSFVPPSLPLVFTDAGLVLGSTCGSPSVFHVYTRDGVELVLDAGPGTLGLDPFLFRAGASPGVRFFDTPVSYEDEKRVVALAAQGEPYFFVAANLPQGSEAFGLDAGTDGGSAPTLARVGAADFDVQQVGVLDCPQTVISQWETAVVDPSGQTVFAVARTSEQAVSGVCMLKVAGTAPPGIGSSAVGLHRYAFVVTQAGSELMPTNALRLGEVEADAGALLLAADGPSSLYFAGVLSGGVEDLDLASTSLAVGNVDTSMMKVTVFHTYEAGPGSQVTFQALVVEPGASPTPWVLGTVTGTLEESDGGQVLAAYDGLSDLFVLKLNPSTLEPSQKYVIGAPGFSEAGVGLAVRSPHVYVAANVTPGAGNDGASYVLGGVSAPLNGGRDVIVFRLTVP